MKATMIGFLKNRFPLAILASILFFIVAKLNFQEFVFLTITLTLSLFMYSLIHELGHAIMATILGIKVTKITLQRVCAENEPTTFEEIRNSKDRIKYGIIAMSGSFITILCGYILLYFAHDARYGIGKIGFSFWFFTLIIFLTGDCGYLIFGSVSMNGDPVGISAGFGISRWVIFSIGIILLLVNFILIWKLFYIAT